MKNAEKMEQLSYLVNKYEKEVEHLARVSDTMAMIDAQIAATDAGFCLSEKALKDDSTIEDKLEKIASVLVKRIENFLSS